MFSGNRWMPMELADTMMVISICIALIIVAALLWFSRPLPSKDALIKKQKPNRKSHNPPKKK